MNNPKKIIIHHAAEIDTPKLEWGQIRKYHMTADPRKPAYIDIGYHAGVELVNDQYEILMGRDWLWSGAHCIGQNSESLGFCFVGDFNKNEPTDGMLIKGAKLIAMWMELFKIPLGEVLPHYHFEATDCPGKKFPMIRLSDIIEERSA
jgi:hypothetical protein